MGYMCNAEALLGCASGFWVGRALGMPVLSSADRCMPPWVVCSRSGLFSCCCLVNLRCGQVGLLGVGWRSCAWPLLCG